MKIKVGQIWSCNNNDDMFLIRQVPNLKKREMLQFEDKDEQCNWEYNVTRFLENCEYIGVL